MIGTLRVYTSRLATKESYWIFHKDGDDFDLKVSDPKNPSYLLIANDPEMESIIGALNALILNRLVTRVNTDQGRNIPVSIIVDELPTLYFHKIDRLIGTARSNKVSVALGFQELPQLEADYGKVGMQKIITTVGNVVSGSARAKETLEWLSNDIFGKVVQLKKGVTIDRDKTSINLNENMDNLVPASKISDMATGWICGQVARDFTKTKTGMRDQMNIQEAEEFKTLKFFCKTDFDMASIQKEESEYIPLPKFYTFKSKDARERILYANFIQVNKDVKNMINEIFRKKTTDYELNITGSIKRKERFRTYIKIPELATFLREITDYRTAEMINLDVPQKNVRFLSDKPTIAQEEMIGRLVSFAGSGNWDDLGLDIPQPDNLDMAKMLVATNVARKMALDMRLLGDKFADDPGNKASRCAATIYDYYVRSKSNKGTQFVFSDLSTYKSNEWNIYQDIKDKLVTMGIPANEIRFIQTAKTEQERKKLFTDMNNGTVRVLFGSTSMLGTGVNAQQRAVAVHHLEVPWRPADLEQRNGRAVRKGNTVKFWGGNVVDIIIYGTEKTLDAYKFNLLRNKQLFINQINNGTIAVRRIDEDSMDENTGMNFAEFVAVLSGNMDLLNKAKLDNRIMQLEKEQAIFNKERYRAERKIAKTEQDIEEAMLTKQRMSEDWAYYKEYKGERKTLLLNLQQAIAEETGRELHKIAKTYRSEAIGTVGSYIGLNLSVRSEYHYTGAFERNIFLVEGKSGLKYKCGLSGALPLGFADSVVYPQATLDKLPELIRRQQEKIDQLANELTTLQQIFSRKWGKTAELDALKQECKELQRKIDNSLKELEQQPAVTVIAA